MAGVAVKSALLSRVSVGRYPSAEILIYSTSVGLDFVCHEPPFAIRGVNEHQIAHLALALVQLPGVESVVTDIRRVLGGTL